MRTNKAFTAVRTAGIPKQLSRHCKTLSSTPSLLNRDLISRESTARHSALRTFATEESRGGTNAPTYGRTEGNAALSADSRSDNASSTDHAGQCGPWSEQESRRPDNGPADPKRAQMESSFEGQDKGKSASKGEESFKENTGYVIGKSGANGP